MVRGSWMPLVAALLAALLLSPVTLKAQAHDPQDLILASVGVQEKLASRIPLQTHFTDQTGKKVLLSRYFTGTPVILTLNYYSCPTLCPLVFRNLVDALHDMKGLTLGKDFRIVTVSIDPNETLVNATDKAATTYAMLGPAEDREGNWPFLLGAQSEITRLAQSVGVRYTRVGENDFAHPTVMVILTPEGEVSRYLYGIDLNTRDLKMALLEAADGKIGGSQLLNRALLACFHYDPVGKKYEIIASRVMVAGMTGFLVLLGTLLTVLWQKERGTPQS